MSVFNPRVLHLALALWLSSIAAIAPRTQAGELLRIELAPGDVVRVALLDRPELSGEFTVSDDGAISLHLIGRTPVAGLTISEFEAALAEKVAVLGASAGSLRVEPIRYGPVYVTGEVANPGAFAFTPGLTVRQAIALAGGLYRGLASETDRHAARLADERLRMRQVRQEIGELLALRDRLSAELEGREELRASEELVALVGEDLANDLVLQQTEQMRLRREELELSIDAALSRAALSTAEATSLAQQQAIFGAQLAASEAALRDVESLLERGLTQTARVLDLRGRVGDYRLGEMQARSMELRARVSAVDAEAESKRLPSLLHRQTVEDFADVEARLRNRRAALDGARSFVAQFGGAAALAEAEPSAKPQYSVSAVGSAPRLVDADHPLLPRDVLEVRVTP